MSIQLTIISLDFDSAEKPQTLVFDKPEVTLGRNSANDVVLQRPDVADLHATLRMESNGNGIALYVVDHATATGTKIENNPVPPGVETALSHNQRITIGTYLIKPLLLSDELKPASHAAQDGSAAEPFRTASPAAVPQAAVEPEAPQAPAETALEEKLAALSQPEPDFGTSVDFFEVEPLRSELAAREPATAGPPPTVDGEPLLISITVDGSDVVDIDFEATELFTVVGTALHKGKALGGVEIDAGPLGKTSTDSHGRFSFERVIDGTQYDLKAEKEGFIFRCTPSEGSVAQNIEIAVEATALYDIKGTLTHKGRGLAGVAVNGGDLGTTVSNEKGEFYFLDVPEGTAYSLELSKEKFKLEPAVISAELGPGHAEHGAKAVELFTVAGRVVHKGKPLAGVEIDGGPLGVTVTDENGRYQFSNVPEGLQYTLTARKDGFLLNEGSRK